MICDFAGIKMKCKSDCFLLNVKEIYPDFLKPSVEEYKIWEKMLNPYSAEEIIMGLKKWRKVKGKKIAPNVEEFGRYLGGGKKDFKIKGGLPFNPEGYLMEQDIKAGRCKHFYPTYCKAVRYIFNVRLKELYKEKGFKDFSYSQKYRLAVENGLFADFDDVLDFVKESGEYYG